MSTEVKNRKEPKGINLQDEAALNREIATLTKEKEIKQEVNKIMREKNVTWASKQERIQGLLFYGNLDIAVQTDGLSHQRYVFRPSDLTHLSNRIRYLKGLLPKIKSRDKRSPAHYEIGNVKVVENYKDKRLQLYFPKKPSSEIENMLRVKGFYRRKKKGIHYYESSLNNGQIQRMKDIIVTE